MPHYTGHNLYISFGSVNLSGDWLQFEFERRVDVIDLTSAGEADFRGKAGIQHGHWTLTIYDVIDQSILMALTPGALQTLIIGPQGTTPGSPRFGFNALVTARRQHYTVDERAVLTVHGIKLGAMLYDDGDTF